MATQTKPPLDEILYRRPEIIQWWVGQLHGKPMEENFIHRYFSESQFFDWTSKNGLLMAQSITDMNLYQAANNRKAFEANIRNRPGLEYLIVQEPQPVADKELAAQGVTTGIWVIRKQDRREAPREPHVRPPTVLTEKGVDGKDRWELTVLGTYFVVGEAIYQAPNLFDVVGNRVTSAANKMRDFFDIADDLPRYTPAIGHHYLPPQVSKSSATSASVPGTPARSREGSVALGEDTQSLRSGSVNPDSQVASAAATSNARDSKLLGDSLTRAVLYGDEYTDENPLVGEPGNLRFTTSAGAVKKRRADEEAAAAKARAQALAKESASASRAPSPKPKPEKPSIFTSTEAKAATKTEKGSKDDRRQSKAKRRKSRIGGTATSPTTPSSATTPGPNSAS